MFRAFTPGTRFTALAFVAIMVGLGPASVAVAANCTTHPSSVFKPNNPPTADIQNILDTLSSYSWALDDKAEFAFDDLFASNGTYEVCTAGGQLYRANKSEILLKIRDQFQELGDAHLLTRHILSNTLLRSTNVDTVETKTTLLVTVQSIQGYRPQPDLDYSAELRTTLIRDPLQPNGMWKFTQVIVFGDSPTFEPAGR